MGDKMDLELRKTQIEKHQRELETFYTPEFFSVVKDAVQSRSGFQLEKFVLGQHDTEPMKFFQLVLEMQSLYYSARMTMLQAKKTNLEIDRLLATGDEIDAVEAEIKMLDLEQMETTLSTSMKEIKFLGEKYESLEKKYTREEIEADQETYWSQRLNRQAILETVAGGSPSYASHLDALRQIGNIKIDNGQIFLEDSSYSNAKIIE